jgi:hypothetical protein
MVRWHRVAVAPCDDQGLVRPAWWEWDATGRNVEGAHSWIEWLNLDLPRSVFWNDFWGRTRSAALCLIVNLIVSLHISNDTIAVNKEAAKSLLILLLFRSRLHSLNIYRRSSDFTSPRWQRKVLWPTSGRVQIERPVFLKIAEIRWDWPGLSQKIDTIHQKIGTIHQKISAKIKFDHLWFFSLHQIFEHWF